jgi:DNA-binding CsgD family transcriptional regulator
MRKHLERVYHKLGVENRAAAMRLVWEKVNRQNL